MFRDAQLRDLQRVFEINEKYVPHVGRENLQWFEKYLSDSDVFWVYESESEVQGYLVAMLPHSAYTSENFLWFKQKYENFLYVDRIAIDGPAQGRGVGRLFYQKLAEVWQSQVPRITCEVNIRPANPQSYQFHTKLGFKEIGQQETKGGTIRVAMLEWMKKFGRSSAGPRDF